MNIINRLQTDFSGFFDEISESHIRLRSGLEIKLTDSVRKSFEDIFNSNSKMEKVKTILNMKKVTYPDGNPFVNGEDRLLVPLSSKSKLKEITTHSPESVIGYIATDDWSNNNLECAYVYDNNLDTLVHQRRFDMLGGVQTVDAYLNTPTTVGKIAFTNDLVSMEDKLNSFNSSLPDPIPNFKFGDVLVMPLRDGYRAEVTKQSKFYNDQETVEYIINVITPKEEIFSSIIIEEDPSFLIGLRDGHEPVENMLPEHTRKVSGLKTKPIQFHEFTSEKLQDSIMSMMTRQEPISFLSKDGSFELIIGNSMPPLGVNYYPLSVDIMIRDIGNHRFNKVSSGHVNYENLMRLLRDGKSALIDNLTEYDEEYVDKTESYGFQKGTDGEILIGLTLESGNIIQIEKRNPDPRLSQGIDF
ncbi:hypothetical protein HJ090_09890 [Vibrio parahaemolyticus]|nr:hypothetical protein [Vibrio parahaemolyticus]TBT51944.1 hypothetical protein D5E78_09150 [Vibrio parahaemolyticus]